MNTQDVTIQVLDLLEEHERVIGRLYAAYAERFPQDRTFWQGLSREEDKHAQCRLATLKSARGDMAMKVSPSAGKPAELSMLVNVPKLITTYYTEVLDASVPEQRVAFGTSGHRGSAYEKVFNE